MKNCLTALLVIAAASASASAATLSPVSYSMINGRTGFQNYLDETYGGPGATGNPLVASSFLSGGLGQLTDGVIGTNDILANGSFDWVGWLEVTPVITFDFGSVVTIETLDVHAASISANFGDVDLPGTVVWEFSNDGVTFGTSLTRTTSSAESNDPSSQWLSSTTSQNARYVRATLTDGVQPWIFVSEFAFTGVPTPGAAGLAMLAVAAGLRRRR